MVTDNPRKHCLLFLNTHNYYGSSSTFIPLLNVGLATKNIDVVWSTNLLFQSWSLSTMMINDTCHQPLATTTTTTPPRFSLRVYSFDHMIQSRFIEHLLFHPVSWENPHWSSPTDTGNDPIIITYEWQSPSFTGKMATFPVYQRGWGGGGGLSDFGFGGHRLIEEGIVCWWWCMGWGGVCAVVGDGRCLVVAWWVTVVIAGWVQWVWTEWGVLFLWVKAECVKKWHDWVHVRRLSTLIVEWNTVQNTTIQQNTNVCKENDRWQPREGVSLALSWFLSGWLYSNACKFEDLCNKDER